MTGLKGFFIWGIKMAMDLMAVKMPPDKLKALRREAVREGHTFPGLVRRVLEDYLASKTAVPPPEGKETR